MTEQTVTIRLENGEVLHGYSFGAPLGEVVGELVFTTAMTGYLETLSDPSYYGQVVVQTFPLIGNYGVIPADLESGRLWPKAYIVREWCHCPSNFRSEGDLDTFFTAKGMPGVYGVDTRRLTRIIREHGTMNALLTAGPAPASAHSLQALRGYRVRDALAGVTRQAPETFDVPGAARHVVLWDFGSKQNIIRELNKRGCRVTAVPAGTSAGDVLALRPDGVMLSNGPGDPAENTAVIAELRRVSEAGIPLFGICLGHQLLALARGGKTEKLRYGHRGANQPVRDTVTGRVYITSQNHGYAVCTDAMPGGADIRFCNLNDGTCEGIDYRDIPAFSVQFHPEACGGPLDTRFLFDRFIDSMERKG